MSDTITVVVNGKKRRLEHGQSVLGLLAALELDPRAVVVELNREIMRRPALEDRTLQDGDCVELVHFVGGG
jgi:thiamine biosynthesis protein ThiS